MTQQVLAGIGAHAGRRGRVDEGVGVTATDPADDAAAASEGVPGPAALGAEASPAEAASDQAQIDDRAILRIANLPRDVGWMMVSVGILGVILPGLPGAPFLLGGIAVLTPGGPRLLTRWAGRKPKGLVHTSLKQMGRWLDDLDRRYP
jgi:hypothetical protein